MTAITFTPMVRRLGVRLDSLAPAQFLALLLALGSVLIPRGVFNDPDTYWHIAAGGWMIDHARVLRQDIFSYTVPGKPWASHEWLAEILMALAYRAGGWSGILVLFAGSLGLALWLVARGLGRWLGGLGQVVVMLLVFQVIGPTVLARPHLLMLPILAGWTLEMLFAREEGRAPRWWFALLMVVWANLHGSFVFGFVLAAGFGFEALIEKQADRIRVIREWGLFGGLCLLAALATPHGISGLVAPFQIMGMGTLNNIIEWQPASFAKFSAFEAGILLTFLVCLAKGVRVPLVRTILLVFILHMAFQHQRHQLVLAIVAALILARPIAQAFGRTEGAIGMIFPARVLLVVVAVAAPIVRLAIPVNRGDADITPASALAHVPAKLAAQPVFNAYNFGGYLIFKGVKVFVDGRADMYGDAYMKRYAAINGGDPAAVDAALKQYKIAWVITQPREGIVKYVQAKPGWKRIYGDKYAVVLAREDALAQ
jgi:hypothetical protein